jgi:iron complex outermembrane recepter protein
MKMNSALLRLGAALIPGTTFLLASLPAAAAGASADNNATAEPAGLEEIVVTAQKREQRLQDVPISMSVTTGADLDKSSLQSVSDALGQIPGVAVNVTGQGGETLLTIRGVTAAGPLFSGPSPIGYYLDSVPFGLVGSSVEPNLNSYDLDHIEVLRGPQGTLYGASALNGVVRVLTNDAQLNDFDFKARASSSSTDGGGGNYSADMAVNMPIIDDVLAARLVVGEEHDSGWINSPLGNGINTTDEKDIRFKVTAVPMENLTIKASATHEQVDSGAPPTAQNDYTPSTKQQPITSGFNAFDIKTDYQTQYVDVTSATSYLEFRDDGSLDTDPGVDTPPLTTNLSSHVFTEELNLTSKLQGPWRWSAGAFYRSARDDTYQTLGDLIPDPVSAANTSKSEAIFGELARRFLDNQLELSVGGRYFHDEVGLQQLGVYGQPVGTPLINTTTPFNATTPRVVLSWFPDHDLTMYASYAQGFRSGYPQSILVQLQAPNFEPVKPDKLTNYEIGSKGNLFDNRLTFDMAVYYMKWNDIQQTLGIPVAGTTAFIVANVNGQAASGAGVDFAVTAKPVQGLTLGVNFSWNGLHEDSTVLSGGDLLFPSGSRIDDSPAYTAGALIEYNFPLGTAGWTGDLAATARYTSEQTTTHTSSGVDIAPIVAESNSITTGRVSFAVAAPQNWRVMLYVDNVGNNRDVPLAGYPTPDFNVSMQPRTAGVQVDYHYK